MTDAQDAQPNTTHSFILEFLDTGEKEEQTLETDHSKKVNHSTFCTFTVRLFSPGVANSDASLRGGLLSLLKPIMRTVSCVLARLPVDAYSGDSAVFLT